LYGSSLAAAATVQLCIVPTV